MELVTFLKLWVLFISMTMLACLMASTIGNQWVELTTIQKDGSSIVALTNGLWKECVDDMGNGYLCRDVENQPGWMVKGATWLGSVRALAVSSCVLGFIAVISTVVGIYKRIISYVAVYSCLLAGCLMTAGLAVFHRDNNWVPKYQFDYGWTFDIGVTGAVLSAVAFLLGLFVSVYLENKQVREVGYERQQTQIKNVC